MHKYKNLTNFTQAAKFKFQKERKLWNGCKNWI